MPKKKIGQRKKAEKQKLRQKEIHNRESQLPEQPCNVPMDVEVSREMLQKSHAFCYFCQTVRRLQICAQCGKQKCMLKTGDCVIRHLGVYKTGLQVVGAICDHCEAWICHERKCLQSHACTCPLMDAVCIECECGVWDHGDQMYKHLSAHRATESSTPRIVEVNPQTSRILETSKVYSRCKITLRIVSMTTKFFSVYLFSLVGLRSS